MAKTVLVTGDLLEQVDLLSEQVPPHKGGGPLPCLRVESLKQPGGNLASLVENGLQRFGATNPDRGRSGGSRSIVRPSKYQPNQ